MLITFTSRAWADIVMFEDVAKALLGKMQLPASSAGVIRADDIDKALQFLRSATAEQAEPALTESDEDGDEEPDVSLRQRALPLIELLEAAQREECDVIWQGNE